MWDSERPMSSMLAAAEAGQGELPSEAELRARLEVLNKSMWENGRSVQQQSEYFAICEALDRLATKSAA